MTDKDKTFLEELKKLMNSKDLWVELKPGERIVDDSDPRQVAIDALLAYKQTLDRKRVLIIEKDHATRSENFEAHFASNQAGRIWAALRALGVDP